jgi:phosphinothricin acetyltransferase
VEIRAARPGDAVALAEIYAPVVTESAISFEEVPPSADEMALRVARVLETHPWLVADDGGEVVGYAYATRHRERAAYRWAVDVSAYVAAGRRGRGIGRTLYTALFEELRGLGYLRAYAGVVLPNPASEALHESVGFREIGVYREVGFKFGRWHDVRWYGLTLGRREAAAEREAPAEPIPFSAARPPRRA